jgi:hypothetical protein
MQGFVQPDRLATADENADAYARERLLALRHMLYVQYLTCGAAASQLPSPDPVVENAQDGLRALLDRLDAALAAEGD